MLKMRLYLGGDHRQAAVRRFTSTSSDFRLYTERSHIRKNWKPEYDRSHFEQSLKYLAVLLLLRVVWNFPELREYTIFQIFMLELHLYRIYQGFQKCDALLSWEV